MSLRQFLGISFRQIYYKSSPVVVIPYAYSFYKLLITKKTSKKRYFICSVVFCSCLIISGSRANMLTGLLVPLIIFLFYLFKNKKNLFGFFLFLVPIVMLGFVIIFKLLNDSNEASLLVKTGHMYSYIELFSENPLRIIMGYGPGSMFYSYGKMGMVSETELTYLEMFRRYGVVGALLLLWIFICPLIHLSQNLRNDKNYFPFLIGYIGYLFIGGTNPLLFSSTGIVVLIQYYMLCDKDNMKMAQCV
jgi:O-antigen ligase